jgi:hypothetical protein
MSDANALTRELTAIILQNYGLLDEPAAAVVPIHLARPIREAMRRKAATLRHDAQQLYAQAVILCREAEELCKPRRS